MFLFPVFRNGGNTHVPVDNLGKAVEKSTLMWTTRPETGSPATISPVSSLHT
jgi:hypothetical protein